MTSTPAHGDLEKQDLGFTSTAGGQAPQHPHLARVRERLRHFLHPNGKRIHVANSPEDAAHLRRRLAQIHSEDEFDVYISGSPEHLDALRLAQTHHEDRREQLRQQHSDVYDRFADVHNELDALAQ